MMRPITLTLLAATIAATSCQPGSSAAAPAPTYFVNYEKGSDQNSGRSSAESWKHAPGDPQATANAGATALKPGDVVSFAAGVTYRGQIVVNRSGSREQPITFEGAAGAPAVINGSDFVEALPCAGNPRCAGAGPGAIILKIESALALRGTIFDGVGPMRLAQAPDPVNAFYPDEPSDFHAIAGSSLSKGQIRLEKPVPDCNNNCAAEIAVWVKPNVVVSRPIIAIENSVARFDPAGLRFYTDRESRYAIRGLRQALDQPGEFIVLDQAHVLALPRAPEGCCTVASGRGGIILRNASWVTIRNLHFQQMADGDSYGKGVAIQANTPGTMGVTIEGNTFRNLELRAGTGAINLRGTSELTLRNNQIQNIMRGSGIRLIGPLQQAEISGNRIAGIGRTAIYVVDANDVEVTRNWITDVRGVHGNGLTAYLGNQRVAFRRNTVLDAKQPATFHGAGERQIEPNQLVFEENLLAGTPDSLGALISWGNSTRGVLIRDNVLLGPRFGLRMSKKDHDVIAAGNIGMPPAPTAGVTQTGGGEANRWYPANPPWQDRLLSLARSGGQAPVGERTALCRALFRDGRSGRHVGATISCP